MVQIFMVSIDITTLSIQHLCPMNLGMPCLFTVSVWLYQCYFFVCEVYTVLFITELQEVTWCLMHFNFSFKLSFDMLFGHTCVVSSKLPWLGLMFCMLSSQFLCFVSHVSLFMQVFILFSDGSIFVLCPVVPFGW